MQPPTLVYGTFDVSAHGRLAWDNMVCTFPCTVNVTVPFSDCSLQTNIAGPIPKPGHVHYAAYFTWEQETCKL